MAASASAATVTRYQASLRCARRLTAHAHRCVKLKQGRVSDKARRAPSLVFLCVLDGIVLSIEGLQDYWDTTG